MAARARCDRALGKVILNGEHAVVDGIPAIAVGIDTGAWAEASVANWCRLHP